MKAIKRGFLKAGAVDIDIRPLKGKHQNAFIVVAGTRRLINKLPTSGLRGMAAERKARDIVKRFIAQPALDRQCW